jgi:basic membrane protein A
MTGKVRNVFAILVASALAVSACSSSGATTAPSTAPTGSNLKIGVALDVGRVDDKNFNQFSWEGAKQAADALGATANYVVPKDPSDYDKNIQGFIDQGYNVVVGVGFNLGTAVVKAAKANPNVSFVIVDVAPCVDETGAPDSTFSCKGDASKLLPKLTGIQFQEDQVGYLAGIVAASTSKKGVIGQLGAVNSNPAVVKYLQGYILGAQSINPNIKVETAFFSTGDPVKAYGDPTWGKTFSAQFIPQKGVDVVFQVAGNTGNGTLDAACDAGIWGIGVDVDQYLSYPNASKCIIFSAEKKLSKAVSDSIKAIAAGTAKGGVSLFNAANDGVGGSPLYNASAAGLPADLQGKLDAAFAAMKAGTLKTCPDKCGTWSAS